MATFCQIIAGAVVNRAVFDNATLPEDWPDRDTWVASEEAQVGWGYDGEGFIPPPPTPLPAPSASDVKKEAARRIEAVMPDYKQRNVLAFGFETIMTYGHDPADWPAPLQAINLEMQAKWLEIKAIRVRSDEIEAMKPIPADFRKDRFWPKAELPAKGK